MHMADFQTHTPTKSNIYLFHKIGTPPDDILIRMKYLVEGCSFMICVYTDC